MDLSRLKHDLDGIKIEDHPAIVQQKSRDFYWYSPILKRQLDHVKGDAIVSPKSEEEVIRVLAACHQHGVPVTPRGSGTGNYGQAMPLSGGSWASNGCSAPIPPSAAPIPTCSRPRPTCWRSAAWASTSRPARSMPALPSTAPWAAATAPPPTKSRRTEHIEEKSTT